MQTIGISETFLERNAEVPHMDWEDQYQDAPAVKEGLTDCSDFCEIQLVMRAQSGDCVAMTDLLGLIRPRCMSVALKVLHNFDDAQDAVQDASLKIWKNLSVFEGRSSLFTWIHRIVVNSCLDFMRRMSNQPTHLKCVESSMAAVESKLPVFRDTPEQAVIDKELITVVRGAVEALPLVHRQAIKLRVFDELAYDEIARVMDCPIGTVMSRVHHARYRLAESLEYPLS